MSHLGRSECDCVRLAGHESNHCHRTCGSNAFFVAGHNGRADQSCGRWRRRHTLLTEATAAEVWLGLLSHLLSRLSDDTSPLAVVDAISGLDARPKVMVQVSRGPSGWNVTLTNNMGVTKEPSTTATIDPTALMTVTVALRPGYGTRITRATATRTGGRALPLSAGGNVTFVIPAGDLVVLGLETV